MIGRRGDRRASWKQGSLLALHYQNRQQVVHAAQQRNPVEMVNECVSLRLSNIWPLAQKDGTTSVPEK
ncbi:MAG: hypothetical protein ABL891_18325 [Burkholderiales bacterium]